METEQENGCNGMKKKKPLAYEAVQLLPTASGADHRRVELPVTSKRKSRSKLSDSFTSSCRRWSPQLPSLEELQIRGAMRSMKLQRTHQDTKVQRPSSDRISTLPSTTIEKILTLMPIKDALRTSILSRKWRYIWTGMPVLAFDDKVVKVSSRSKQVKKYKFMNAISHVLFLHKGPILEFNLSIGDRELVNEIDLIILHISRIYNMKKFIFKICLQFHYKIPSWFFLSHGLEHLDLTYCAIELPLTFYGFNMLRSLRFCNVEITTKMLQRFLTHCKLLEEFTLIGKDCSNMFFESLPSVEFASGMPRMLPTPLTHMRILVFSVCFHELSYVLCMISSSPNLEKIKMEMCCKHWMYAPQTSQDYSDLKLDHLNELEITKFRNYAPEKAFLKLIMAKSPVLKKARMELHPTVSVNGELEILRDLLQMPFPRASPAANFIVERPKSHGECI